jgi:hypothetical protein
MDIENIIKKPSLWLPMTNKVDLAVLGKLGEEATECGTAVFRTIIQGIHECEPVTGKPNMRWLEDEIADVRAMSKLAMRHFEMDYVRIDRRINAKLNMKLEWLEMIREHESR